MIYAKCCKNFRVQIGYTFLKFFSSSSSFPLFRPFRNSMGKKLVKDPLLLIGLSQRKFMQLVLILLLLRKMVILSSTVINNLLIDQPPQFFFLTIDLASTFLCSYISTNSIIFFKVRRIVVALYKFAEFSTS